MIKKLIFFCVFINLIFADDFDEYFNVTIDKNNFFTIENCLNLLTGQIYFNETDIIANAKEPIEYGKSYHSLFFYPSLGKFLTRGRECEESVNSGWGSDKHLMAYIYRFNKEEKKGTKKIRYLDIYEPNGAMLRYDFPIIDHPKTNFWNSKTKKELEQRKFELKKEEIRELEFKKDKSSYQQTITGAKDNYKNTKVFAIGEHDLKVYLSDGCIRYYQREEAGDRAYALKYEILLNGNIKEYTLYGEYEKEIVTKSPRDKIYAKMSFDKKFDKKKDRLTDEYLTVETHDQKKAFYHYHNKKTSENNKKKFCLYSKKSPFKNQKFEYYKYEKLLLKDIKNPNDRILNFTFESNKKEKDIKRVSEIKTYLENRELTTLYKIYYDKIARFNKNEGITRVEDSLGNETKYYFSDKFRLEKIEKYEKHNNNQVLKSTLKFIFGSNEQEGFLLSKVFLDENQIAKKIVNYIYDDKNIGNLIKEITIGESSENNSFITTFSYYDNNLLKTITNPNGLTTKLTYHKCKVLDEDFTTNLISTKFLIHNNQIKQRFFYKYDEDNLLLEEIVDDGNNENSLDLTNVNRRVIKKYTYTKKDPLGQVKTYEKYLVDKTTNKLIEKEEYEYSIDSKIIKKIVLDPLKVDEILYSINFKYDETGNLISQTDPINRETTTQYDENFNKILEKDFFGLTTQYEYDFSNRLTKKITHGFDKNYIEEFKYDKKNNILVHIDINNNKMSFEYDFANNLIKEIKPKIEISKNIFDNPIYEYRYDSFNRLTKKTDPNKNIIKTKYNMFDKPIEIIYEDGSIEKFIYNNDGTLKKHIDKKNIKTTFEYDYLNREISKKIFSLDKNLLKEEFFEYDAFDLIKKTDFNKNYIIYTYDDFNRKIKEEFFDNKDKLLSISEFFYDSYGNVSKKIDGNVLLTTYARDKLNRIIKKQILNENNQLLRKVEYEYADTTFFKILKTISYVNNKQAIDTKKYDIFNRLVLHIDAMNHETKFFYNLVNENNQNFLKQVTLNSLMQKTIEFFDPNNNLKKIEKLDCQNEIISKQEFFYDLNNNLINHQNHIYSKTFFIDTIQTKMEYDNLNRLLSITEAYNSKKSKTTKYEYDQNNNKTKILKPNKTPIYYEYDEFDNNIRVLSSDIDYKFTYNKLDQLTNVVDNANNKITTRVYDPLSNLVQENLSNDLEIKHEYDLLSNKIKTTFHAGSFIEYSYDPINLLKVTKKDNFGNEEYFHEFLKYDLSGNLLEENLILNYGRVVYDLDNLSRTISINTPYHTQNIKYDQIGRIKYIDNEGFLNNGSFYSYDSLNQLTRENSIFKNIYEYDSNYNLTSKNNQNFKVNALNELISIDEEEFFYDENGNLIFDKKNNEKYLYDSLDRLIKIEKEGEYILDYEYDPFNRRISKKKYLNSYLSGKYLSETKYFYYQDLNEIGSFDENYNLKELRVLSNTKNAELGSGISFEIDGYAYAPIYDVSRNVQSLIYNNYVYEHYRYSSFGEKKIFNSKKYEIKNSYINNPWQFSSKRLDDNGFIYFLRRYYSPKYGRWISCDPKGFIDGYNLYSYVSNNPLVKMDLYGLYANPWMLPKTDFNYDLPPLFEKAEIIPIIGNSNTSSPYFVVSGQGNTKKEFIEGLQVHYNKMKNLDGNLGIVPIYTGSKGVFLDSMLSVLQRNGFYKPKRLEMIKEQINNAAKKTLNSNNPMQKAFFISFSRGALDMYQVLEQTDQKTRDQIISISAGFAKAIPNDFAFYSKNLRGKGDLLPSFMDSFACCGIEYDGFNCKISNRYDIETVPQNEKGPLNGHRFVNEGYQDKLKNHIKMLYKIHGVSND
ncbi:MAG: tRNA(Glu)-specific nuclease WapA [Candidatus Anoxychlamydiales bacterium]|nr:tRNA(Glu)-specific nuclease WapA [Candidatus Anoxychlamydiales bacterium]